MTTGIGVAVRGSRGGDLIEGADAAVFAGVVAAIRAATENPLPASIERSHSFLLDLGFDSLSMVALSLTLEDEFGCPILLDDWIAEQSDPISLTVGSLCAYLAPRLDGHD